MRNSRQRRRRQVHAVSFKLMVHHRHLPLPLLFDIVVVLF